MKRNRYTYHIRTNKHKSKCLLNTEYENVKVVGCAFKNRIVTYRVEAMDKYTLVEDFFNRNNTVILNLLQKSLKDHTCLKVQLELFAYFSLPTSDIQELKSFNTKFKIVYNNTDLTNLLSNEIDHFKTKLSEFEQGESGWALCQIIYLDININKYSPLLGGSSYIDLPASIKHTKSCINIKNNDDCCLLWCVTAACCPTLNNVNRTSSYPHYSNILNIKGMSFPPSVSDIRLLEKNNNFLSINIYGLDKKIYVTGPLYMTKHRKIIHVNLLYFEKKGVGHYCLIKDLSKLVRSQISSHKCKLFLCESCLQYFSKKLKYERHVCSKVLTTLPDEGSVLEFQNYYKKQKINFVIYADFETLLFDCSQPSSKFIHKYKIHKPSSFGFYLACSHDSRLCKYVSYRGPDCVEKFVSSLVHHVSWIFSILSKTKAMSPLTSEQKLDFENSNVCHICQNLLLGDKVADHDHITSFYRGAAHSHCNLNYRICKFVPVVFHNLSGYDCHLFLKELAKYKGDVKVIAKSKEKYSSIIKFIVTEEAVLQIKFIDSLQFLNSKLETLCKNLDDTDFHHLTKMFINQTHLLHLLKRKGVYPYDYMNLWSRYDEKKIPDPKHFYNSLSKEEIDPEDYEHAKNVWKQFRISNLGQYTDLYLKCDVMILCDVFEKFRKTSLQSFKLDPLYYISLPGLSWDAMLFYTGVRLELLHNVEMYEMIEKGIRGGLAQCSLRKAEANNKYLPNYNPSKPSTYLVYLDCVNLYGYAMMKKFPIANFKFLSQDQIDQFNISLIDIEGELGYILEVDLEYPFHLHDWHNDLPYAVEKFIPPSSKTPKLIANLYNKYNYVIHIAHLSECLRNGLILKKIHRVISFKQDDFLKRYIELNTSLRKISKSKFEKDQYKLFINAIFGKTIENKRKHVNLKLVNEWVDNSNKTKKRTAAAQLIAKPNLSSVKVFSENFVAIQLKQEKIFLDKPIYVGFSVLEYAKSHLYSFHYDYIKHKYGFKANLCYTDTDSLLYLIETEDFYTDMKQDIHLFDTSNFEKDNQFVIPQCNEKVPGLFKDELGGDIIKSFIGLRAKLYQINSLNNQINKAKGIPKSITKDLTYENYKKSLLNNTNLRLKMNSIRSTNHNLFSETIEKLVLNSDDDKRLLCNDKIKTLAWGNWKGVF